MNAVQIKIAAMPVLNILQAPSEWRIDLPWHRYLALQEWHSELLTLWGLARKIGGSDQTFTTDVLKKRQDQCCIRGFSG
jgi:hypothetical protein